MFDSHNIQFFENAHLFGVYAGSDAYRWSKLIGWPLFKKGLGNGKLVRIDLDGGILLFISFDIDQEKETRMFRPQAFVDGFFGIPALPPDLDGLEIVKNQIKEKRRVENEKEKQRAQASLQEKYEADARKQYQGLKSKYEIDVNKEPSMSSPLYRTLMQIDGGETLREVDIQLLRSFHFYYALAIYYQQFYQSHGDGWNLVKAGSYFRNSGHSEKALEILDSQWFSDKKLLAAVYTNRGGAYRDKHDLDAAEKCASAAIVLQPDSYYPYNSSHRTVSKIGAKRAVEKWKRVD